jgi:type IV pilus assembly protein PilC
MNKLNKKTQDKGGKFDFLHKEISLSSSGPGDKSREEFYRELGMLLSSGVDVRSALELIVEEQKEKSLEKTLYGGITKSIIQGSSFSEAMSGAGYFSPYEITSIRIGEESGKLNAILQDLASYYQRKIKQKRQIISALSYPILVLSISVGAIYFMLKFIVPMFSDVFKRFGGDLPAITQFIISLSQNFSAYFPFIFVALSSVIILLYTNRKRTWLRKITSALVLRVPVIGAIARQIYLTRFCQTMHLLISSKIPLLTAMGLVKKMIEFYPMEQAIEYAEKKITEGSSLNVCLSRFSVFPKKFIVLVRVGEEVNKLDEIFGELYKQYNQETEHQISLINSLIEPLMIVFLGLIVGVILVAMYLPLFQLSTTIH